MNGSGLTARSVKMPRAVSGQITVFVSLILMCLFTVFCVLVESARTTGARWYLQMAADSAVDSVFSQYHRRLWDSYRLLFAEYEDEAEITEDFAGFLQPYLDVENWYPMAYQSAKVTELTRATDDAAVYLEQEVLDYMKYGIWNLDFGVETEELLRNHGREAEALKEVAESYRGHAKETLKLERALEAISGNLAEENEEKKQGLACLREYDGGGFRRSAADLIRKLEKMPKLVAAYRRQADELAQGLQESRKTCKPQRDQCSEQVNGLLEEEIREYETYVSLDGERRMEIEELEPWSAQQVEQVEAVIEEAREVERIIEEWEEDEDDEDDDGPDLDALWRPVIRRFEQIEIRQLSFSHGVKDKKKEGWLNQVEQMYRNGLLEMLVPDGARVSEKHVNPSEAPSCTEASAKDLRSASLTDHLLVNEYCGAFFRCFCDSMQKRANGGIHDGITETFPNVQEAESGITENNALDYELEYLVGGNFTDEENLSSAVHRLLAIREGLNLIHILSDSGKRAEARNLALTITGLATATPLVLVTTFFVMSVWALGEAMMDVRGLLAGKKVPIIKSAEDWTLSLDGLLAIGSSREVACGGGERGLDYENWLKVLLFLDPIVRQEYRMMDVMQFNLCMDQENFRMRRGVYRLRIMGELCGKHVFYSLGFVEKLVGNEEHRYSMEIEAERSY